ncbi:MAG TPA: response regulator [Methylomirabilota bacterium]|jgi:chemosensory pili system protein ChpA (sensor histidine kinase/response regulator)|nr:response regulator [Methylomirabilota bacterium]
MAREGDGEFLLGIFLMEAWDTAGALEEGLARLSEPAAPVEATVSPLLVLAHRLKGSAALHGFLGLSELAGAAESRLDAAPGAGAAERVETTRFLAELVALFKEIFDGISATGAEDGERIAAFQSRWPAPPMIGAGPAEASVSAAPDAGSEEGPPAEALEPPMAIGGDDGLVREATESEDRLAWEVAGGDDRLAREVNRFFADSGDILAYFVPEATEHLETMTASLLSLEREGRSEEHLATVFRAVHTLKGAAYTVGCSSIGDVAHEIEDLLVAVREGQLAFTPAVVEAALAGADALKLVLQTAGAAPADLGVALDRVLEGVRSLISSSPPLEAPVADQLPVEVGSVASEPEAQPVPIVATSAPAAMRKFRERAPGAIGPSIRVSLDRLDSLMNLVGELMIARSRLERRLAQLDRVGDLLLFSRSRMSRAVRDFEGKHHYPQLPAPRAGDGGGSGPPSRQPDGLPPLAQLFAELEFDRYDDFNILARSLGEVSADVGELQTQHAALIRDIREDMAQIQRLTTALRKEVTRSRMVPIGRLFPRFARQVREASRAAGKDVAFEVHGESVEVDNTTVEQMADSLLHLVQNAIAHGIETDAERVAGGKPARGTVSLRAFQQGGFLIVEVEDDGRGMDPERLKAQAVERGLLGAAAARALSRPEVLNLIFVPGFSTALSVTRASGRGIGLDVVRHNVTRLNGGIEVETELGVRTLFTIKLPLTVAIADALMVRVGGEVFALPLTTVGVMRLVSPGAIRESGGREVVDIDEQSIDLFRLSRLLRLPGSPPPTLIPVVVLRSGGKPFAVAVDELYGKEEIVIKSAGEFLEGVGPFAGATISGEGRVILLLDPSRLFELGRDTVLHRIAEREEAAASPAGEDVERRVLLVDDSISVRKFVGQMLEKAGFQVLTAVDGQDALERLTEVSVDLVITDLEMPRVNGYALIEDLRRRAATREVPVVVLTTRAGEKHQNLARRLGVRHYVAKPVDEQVFVGLIQSILSPLRRELAASDAGRR